MIWICFLQNEIFGIKETSRLFVQGSLAFTGNLNLYLAQFFAGAVIIAENTFSPKKWLDRIELHYMIKIQEADQEFLFFEWYESVFYLLLF